MDGQNKNHCCLLARKEPANAYFVEASRHVVHSRAIALFVTAHHSV